MDADPAGNSIIFQLILIVILTMINAYFAASEMAIVSVQKTKIRRLAADGDKKAKLVERLLEEPTAFLSTIQVAITLAGFFNSASAATGISANLASVFTQWGIPEAQTLSMILITILLSFITLIFGELVPKRVALQKAEWFSMFCARPILIISRIVSPCIKVLSFTTSLVLRIFGMHDENVEESLSREEIRHMLIDGQVQGVIDDDEADMLDGVFAFDDIMAMEIMTPRTDMFRIDIDQAKQEYLNELMEMRYTRIPVYEDSVDNIIGILNIKDYFAQAYKHGFEFVDLRKILRTPFFVPETKKIDDLFREMQKTHQHIAILIDEYGGVSGIVTIEDVIEEIMGDIEDEYDEQEDPMITKLDEHHYLVDGAMSLDDINETLDLALENENHDTLGGFLMDTLGHILHDGEEKIISIDHVEFKIQEVKNHRIEQVFLTLPKEKEICE